MQEQKYEEITPRSMVDFFDGDLDCPNTTNFSGVEIGAVQTAVLEKKEKVWTVMMTLGL